MLPFCRMFRISALTGAALALSTFVLLGAIPLPVRCTAFAVDKMSGASSLLNLTVIRWSARSEVEQLASALDESGPDGLLQRLQRLPRAGSLRVGDGLAIDVHFAQIAIEPDGGQRLMVVAERRIGFNETLSFAPSADYPLTVIELRLDTSGKGTGTMWPVARVNYWDRETQTIVIDNYTWQPVDLMAVRWQGGSPD